MKGTFQTEIINTTPLFKLPNIYTCCMRIQNILHRFLSNFLILYSKWYLIFSLRQVGIYF